MPVPTHHTTSQEGATGSVLVIATPTRHTKGILTLGRSGSSGSARRRRVRLPYPATEGVRCTPEGWESAVRRGTTMSGPYGIVGLVVAVILIFILLRLLGVV